jgi:hypothetical protein
MHAFSLVVLAFALLAQRSSEKSGKYKTVLTGWRNFAIGAFLLILSSLNLNDYNIDKIAL